MTSGRISIGSGNTLGLAGLFLMLLVARLANHGGFLADRTIDAIGVIGWIADHLPLSEPNNLGTTTLPTKPVA